MYLDVFNINENLTVYIVIFVCSNVNDLCNQHVTFLKNYNHKSQFRLNFSKN